MTEKQPGEIYDLIVIGAGPAGEKGAAQAAYFGKRVAIVESGDVGGTSTNTGTLPSKTLRETALHIANLRQRDRFGLGPTLDRELTPEDLFFRERLVVSNYQALVMENIVRHQIDLVRGRALLTGPNSVAVTRPDGTRLELQGRFILIATGSHPVRPEHIPFDGEYVHDSDSILRLKRLPKTLAVVGAGVIGSEYTTLFAALGIPVTLIDGGDVLLPSLDREVAEALLAEIEAAGVSVRFRESIEKVETNTSEGSVRLRFASGEELEAEAMLYCGGRQGNTEGLGLEALGVETDRRGRVAVNESYQTAAPNIYAAGDVIGYPSLASTSMEQGRVAVCHAFGFEYKQRVSSLLPYALYTIPEVSMVGATGEELKAAGRPYLAGRASYRDNPRGQIAGDTTGFIKLLFDPEDQKLLGVHIIGERASEIIHIGEACIYFGGTIDFFIQNVFNFPTFSDLYTYAAYDGLGNLQRWREGNSG